MKRVSVISLCLGVILIVCLSACGDSTSPNYGSLPHMMDVTINDTTYHFTAGCYNRVNLYRVTGTDTTQPYLTAAQFTISFDSLTSTGTYFTTNKPPHIYIGFSIPSVASYETSTDSSCSVTITKVLPYIIGNFKGKLQLALGTGKPTIDVKGTFNAFVPR